MDKLNSNNKQKQGGTFIKIHGTMEGGQINDNLISPGSTLLEVDGMKDTLIERNENLQSSDTDSDLYIEILKWTFEKNRFSEQELFDKFPKLRNPKLKDWYLNIFRGGATNDESLIGVYDDKKGSFYCSLTGKGRLSLGLNSKVNIEKIEVISGDKIGRDKIEQRGQKNKALIKNGGGGGESFFSKFFWGFLVTIIAGLIIVYITYKFGWK